MNVAMPLSAQEFDRNHLWHPYTNVMNPTPTLLARGAEGIWITLDDGTRVIDAMSSWWCMLHGHRHPRITEAMHAQLDTMPHIMFGGLTHQPAVDLGTRLIDITPPGLSHVFYADSGSVAVEVALKMAVQYQHVLGHKGRTQFATIRGGYHGDTWKAMSVCDPVNGMHHLFQGALSIQHFVPRPPIKFGAAWCKDPEKNGLGALADMLNRYGTEIAALVLEPIVQGAGGMYFYHPEYLNGARALCDVHGVLLIFDEIATGFGRTGRLFATDFTNVTPDILCLGKALTGGHISFAATLASGVVAKTIGEGDPGLFMHGPTFMGNPLACAAACASLDILADTDWRSTVQQIETQLLTELAPARDLPNVADVRVLGAIGVIELKHEISADVALHRARETGVFLRPFGRNIYAMPPFICQPEELSQITGAMLGLAACD